MAQLPKIIDVDRSFIPIDPNAFPETYHATDREDFPEKRVPVVPFYGWNFLPTPNGYKSYFGTNKTLAIDSLSSRCDECFIIQTETFDNILVALCEDGIWTKTGEEVGSWYHAVTLSIPPVGEHLNWTYCVIGDKVYAYRATNSVYYVFSNQVTTASQPAASGELSLVNQLASPGFIPAGTYHYSLARRLTSTGALTLPSTGINVTLASASLVYLSIPTVADTEFYRIYRTIGGNTYYRDQTTAGTFEDDNTGWTAVVLPDTSYPIIAPYAPTTATPTFLNMAGQHGIFKAGIRLGFWDSENSVSWSSIDDFTEFTPSVETLAGSAIFSDVAGRITQILDQEEGFVIYSTKSIVYIAQASSETFQWNPRILLASGGVIFQKQVTKGLTINQQFAYTSLGLVKIESGALSVIVPEITDYLTKSADPIYLTLLNERYLCLDIINSDYINAQVRFTYEQVNDLSYQFPAISPIAVLYPEETFSSNLDFCSKASLLAGEGRTTEQQEVAQQAWTQANSSNPTAFPPNPSGFYEPVWDATLCIQEVPDPNQITWIGSPCPTVDFHGVERGMCPQAPVIKTDLYGLGSAGQQTITGLKWDLKKLIQVQTAIWDWEDSKRSQYIAAILSRAFEDQFHGAGAWPPPNGINVSTECLIGQFIDSNAWHDQGWAANKCSFWMTRTINQAIDIYRRRTDIGDPNGSPGVYTTAYYIQAFTPYMHINVTIPEQTPFEQAGLLIYTDFVADYNSHSPWTGSFYGVNFGGPNWVNVLVNWPGLGLVNIGDAAAELEFDSYLFARNRGEQVSIPEIVDRAFCKIVGWKYTDALGFERIVPGITDPECKAPDDGGFTAIGIISGSTPTPEAGDGSLCGQAFPDITIPGYSISPLTWPAQSITIPGDEFLLQKGSIGPIYPTFTGAYVYDLLLKKWGKLKADYRLLVDYIPINSQSDAVVELEDFIIEGGLLTSSGELKLFDGAPTDSKIGWGKIGYYRSGMTTIEEIKVHNTVEKDFSILTHTSLDGNAAEVALTTQADYVNTIAAIAYPVVSGRWHIVEIAGNYDIKYLETKGTLAGRR